MRRDRRIGIVTNHWGWTLRGVRHWLSCWSFPYDVWGVEITSEVPALYRWGHGRLHVFERRIKVGPICFAWGRYTCGYSDGKPAYFDARGQRELEYPRGRLAHRRTQRRLAEIERDNRRRADERAMREGCS